MQTDKEQQWDSAVAKARSAIHDTDGRGMVGRSRVYLQDRVARAILAAEREAASRLEALSSGEAVAGDYVLVPREPTEEMLGASEFLATGASRDDVVTDYQAMIDVAALSTPMPSREEVVTLIASYLISRNGEWPLHDNATPGDLADEMFRLFSSSLGVGLFAENAKKGSAGSDLSPASRSPTRSPDGLVCDDCGEIFGTLIEGLCGACDFDRLEGMIEDRERG